MMSAGSDLPYNLFRCHLEKLEGGVKKYDTKNLIDLEPNLLF